MGVSTVEHRTIEHDRILVKTGSNLSIKIPSFKEQMLELKQQNWSFLLVPGKENAFYGERKRILDKFRSKRNVLRRLNNPLTILGIVIVLLITTWAVFAPLLTWYDFNQVEGINATVPSWAPPSSEHILGTTKFGRDLYSRLIWGARLSLTLGFFPLIISTVFGTILGLIGGYFGGLTDSIIMRISDIIMAFPGLILVILAANAFSNSVTTILLIFGILGISGFARLVRGGVLREKDATYVQAAKVSGTKDFSIIFKHIMPNVISPVIISFTFGIGGNILGLAGLSFLGVTPGGLIEWGTDISISRAQFYSAPWAAFTPGIGVLITVLGFMLLGDGLRDVLDPRLAS